MSATDAVMMGVRRLELMAMLPTVMSNVAEGATQFEYQQNRGPTSGQGHRGFLFA